MNSGNFYFINDDYFKKFSGFGLLENKETVNGKVHGRPCYYAFTESSTNLYWMIPISSKIEKYKEQHEIAMKKYGLCDGISFGYILGDKKAFLVQNMCPVTDKYITNVYINKNTSEPVFIPTKLQSELNAKIRKALRLYRKGTKIVLSKALDIEQSLIEELKEDSRINMITNVKSTLKVIDSRDTGTES
jgi:hypothetical protein